MDACFVTPEEPPYCKAGTMPVLDERENINGISDACRSRRSGTAAGQAKDCSLAQLHAQFLCNAQE
ncbi:hypothetical protein MESS4_110110 [Mesorhizobium sp. STM 4661]|nr:hypothetical protein MESS4_110110 [Mesorhizobium sp. STM 4661]